MSFKDLLKRKCPKCGSSRVIKGYRRSPLMLRLLLVQNLMCDRCNLPFKAFSLPFPRSQQRRRTSRYRRRF